LALVGSYFLGNSWVKVWSRTTRSRAAETRVSSTSSRAGPTRAVGVLGTVALPRLSRDRHGHGPRARRRQRLPRAPVARGRAWM